MPLGDEFETYGAILCAFGYGVWKVWKVVSGRIEKSKEKEDCRKCMKEREMSEMAIEMKSIRDTVNTLGETVISQAVSINNIAHQVSQDSEAISQIREDVGWLRGAIETMMRTRN